jgi:hypothetical protein
MEEEKSKKVELKLEDNSDKKSCEGEEKRGDENSEGEEMI